MIPAREAVQARSGNRAPQGIPDLRARGQGATNPEIAVKLFLSRKTIEAHLARLGRVYAKLGVLSRTELTRVVVQNGLGEG